MRGGKGQEPALEGKRQSVGEEKSCSHHKKNIRRNNRKVQNHRSIPGEKAKWPDACEGKQLKERGIQGNEVSMFLKKRKRNGQLQAKLTKVRPKASFFERGGGSKEGRGDKERHAGEEETEACGGRGGPNLCDTTYRST